MKLGTGPEKVLTFDHNGAQKINQASTCVALLWLGPYKANSATKLPIFVLQCLGIVFNANWLTKQEYVKRLIVTNT